MTRQLLLALVTLATIPRAVPAQDAPTRSLLNVDKAALAIQGYDPVAYFTDNKPVEGGPALASSYGGATYWFSTPDHKAMFDADPARYAPQFGGYCGYGASRGYPAPIDPKAFTIMNGRLILQNSLGVLERWRKDPEEYLRRADANWPSIVAKYGKPPA